jgi:hypothetical protein
MDRADDNDELSSSAAAAGVLCAPRSIPSGGDDTTAEDAVDEEELSLLVHNKTSSSSSPTTMRRGGHKQQGPLISKNHHDIDSNSNDCDDEKSHGVRASHSRVTLCCHRIIDWIQSIEIRAPSSKVGGRGHRVPLIAGLDHVVYGHAAAADVVVFAGGRVQPPRYCFYMLSGALCDVLQFGMDWMLHSSRLIQDDSLCWAVGFFLSVVFRHSSHRYLVFGKYMGGYYKSLCRMYAAYSIIIVLSTLFHRVIMTIQVAFFSHTAAWFLTLAWTGVANYFILKKVWSFGGGGGGGTHVAAV